MPVSTLIIPAHEYWMPEHLHVPIHEFGRLSTLIVHIHDFWMPKYAMWIPKCFNYTYK